MGNVHVPGFSPKGVDANQGLGKQVQGDSGSKLSDKSVQLLKSTFGFKGVTVIREMPGAQGLDGFEVMKQLDQLQSSQLLNDIAKLAHKNSDMDSAIVLIGGHELVKNYLKELEDSLKKMDKAKAEKLKEFLKEVGIAGEGEILVFPDDSGVFPGGLVVVQSSLEEIEGWG